MFYSERLDLARLAIEWLQSHGDPGFAIPTEAQALNLVTALNVLGRLQDRPELPPDHKSGK